MNTTFALVLIICSLLIGCVSHETNATSRSQTKQAAVIAWTEGEKILWISPDGGRKSVKAQLGDASIRLETGSSISLPVCVFIDPDNGAAYTGPDTGFFIEHDGKIVSGTVQSNADILWNDSYLDYKSGRVRQISELKACLDAHLDFAELSDRMGGGWRSKRPFIRSSPRQVLGIHFFQGENAVFYPCEAEVLGLKDGCMTLSIKGGGTGRKAMVSIELETKKIVSAVEAK